MTDIIIHKHSITASDVPGASEIDLGELAIQAADGHIYLKKTDGTINRVTMLPGGTQQQVLYKTGAGNYALGWGTISSTLIGGALWSEVVAEVQRVFALVEGTASVLLSAPATLTAGSTGPLTVSVANATYLTDGTSITGVLGTVYGTLSRSGTTYSFVSNQSYTSDVTFATGTRFAAAFLNDTFNPLRIGSAEVEDDDGYTEGSGYSQATVDSSGRIGYGVKTDGAFDVPSGSISLDDAKIQQDAGYTEGTDYAKVVVDSSGRIGYGVKTDGSFIINDSISFSENALYDGGTGYEKVVVDKDGRISHGIKTDGSFVINDSISFSENALYDELGYAYVITDKNQKIAFAITTSGEVYVNSKVQASFTDSASHGTSGLYTVVNDTSGATQIQAGQDSGVSFLTSTGNNWGPVVTAETPERVAFLSDRSKDNVFDARYWVMNSDGTRQSPATPNKNDITFWGDSMTQRLQSYNFLPGLLSGRTLTFNALGGTSIENIIARQGGENATCTIPSGSIPASGSVALQNVWPSLGYHAGTLTVGATYSYRVLLAGVEGALTSTTNANSQADYIFTRTTAGSSVSVSGLAEIIVSANITQSSFGFSKNNTAVFWLGTNPLSKLPSTTYNPNSGTGIYYKSPATTYDPTNSSAVQARTEAIIQACINRVENLDRHILITGPFIGQGQVWSSQVEKQAIVAGFNTFSKYFYDLRSDFIATCKSWLQTNHSSIYANWAATDDDHVANGATPPILREDGIHPNTYGSELVSQLVSSRLVAKDW